MKRQQNIIRDKQKLFRKLFISPSYCQPLDPPLLVSPDFINLLLQESAHTPRQYQLQLIDELLNIFTHRPTNSLLLSAYDEAKAEEDKCILDGIVMRIMMLVNSQEQVELYLQKIALVLAYYRIGLRNFRRVLQWISKNTYLQKFQPIKLMFAVRLIKLYYSRKLGQSKSPLHYFYLFGSQNAGIQPVQHSISDFSFKNELTIIISFNSQGESTISPLACKPYNLFLLKSERDQQIGLTYTKGTLKLTALSNGKFLQQLTIVKQLSDQVWYRLIVNINTYETQCILGNQTYKNKPLIKRDRQRKIVACVFGREFFGMIGNILIGNKNISLQKFDVQSYPYSIDSIADLRSLTKTGIPPTIIASCLPILTFEVRESMHCFDVFKRNHSIIGDNVVIVDKPTIEANIDHLGGCAILLPLFYLARFYDPKQYSTVLQDLLEIILEIMKTYNIQNLQNQFQQAHFFEILGQHLTDVPHLQTSKSVNMIFSIFKKLKRQKMKLIFIRDLIWFLNIGIDAPFKSLSPENRKRKSVYQQFELKTMIELESSGMSPTRVYRDELEDTITEYYSKLLSLYKTQPVLAFKSMPLSEIIYWAVQHLETNQNMAFSCCLQHHLNQSVLSNEINVEQLAKLESAHIRTHYRFIEEILKLYLQNMIKNCSQEAQQVQQIKILLRLFLQKYSACLYMLILLSIKHVVVHESSSKQMSKILIHPKLQLIPFLTFLSQKTINPDIITEIIFLALYVHKYTNSTGTESPNGNIISQTSSNDDVAKFIINLFKINQSIQVKQWNPVRTLAKKIRKFSWDCHTTSPKIDKCMKIMSEDQINELEGELGQQSDSQSETKSMLNVRHQKGYEKPSEISQHRLTRIICRSPRPQKLCSYHPIYNLIMNLMCGEISAGEPTSERVMFAAYSVLMMKEYYKLAQRQFKQSILLFLLSSLEKKPQLRQINELTIFLLQCLRSSIYECPQQTKNLLTIFTCIFSQILTNHKSIYDFYSSIKFLKFSRATITLVLPLVLSKVIKLADIDQVMDLAMISVYQIIQSPGESSLQLGRMVLQRIHDVVIFSNGDQYMLFSKVMCEHPDKQNSLIIDPFEDASAQTAQTRPKSPQKQLQIEKNTQIFELSQRKNSAHQKKICKSSSKSSEKQQQSVNRNRSKSPQPPSPKKVYKLTAFEIYIKMFFKVFQKLCCDTNQEEDIRNSIKKLQNSSLIKKTKSAEINYSYEFRSKNILAKQFNQIIISYFNKFSQDKIDVGQKNFRYLLSCVLYKIAKLNNQIQDPIIKVDYIIAQIFEFASKSAPKKQGLAESQQNSNDNELKLKTALMSFFCKGPFQFNITDLLMWKTDPQIIQTCFKNHYITQVLIQQQKYSQFFTQVEDTHDLIIVSFYQKNMQKYVQQYQISMTNFASQKSYRNIQKLFDPENAAEQKTRITYLYQNQCRFRKQHYQWDKLWNKLRVYHQPYGFWMAQKFKDNVYVYPHGSIRNFKFQMSQFSSQSGLYPVLEAKILDTWAIVKDNRVKKNKYINSFSQMMKPSHIKVQKSESQNNIFTNVWKGMLGLSKKKINSNIKVHEYDVVLISRSTKATGKLFIQNKQELIFCYEGARQEDTHLSFQKFSLAFNRETYQKWHLYSLQKIKVHRYLLKYQALQIIFCDGRAIIFDFVKGDKDSFVKQLQKIQKQKLQNSNQKLFKINKIPFFEDTFFDLKGLDWKIVESWQRRQISNLQYLILLNKAASRGIYDLSQYMVVPWVVQFRRQKEPKFRDLTKTMGGLGSEQRKKIISQKYYAKDPFNPYPPFFFGTHYSSPGVVFNILIRLSPFTEYCKHLQGGKFDIPDRLFSSLVGAWRSASQQVSDVRQLIPQIYYLPQALINIDQNYFGYTQNKQLINHVQIPPWGANNPYYFTSQLRQIMQSQQVSQRINQWIDLIFGYKQRGKQAEINYNVYYYLTYEDNNIVQEDQDDVYKKSKQAQIVHFGQIPPMLFDKPHPKRNKPPQDCIYQIKIIKSVNLMNTLKQKPIGLKISNNELMICKRNQFEVYSIQSDPAALQKKKKFNFEKSITETYYVIKKEKSRIVYMEKPYFIIWGYLSNEFRVFSRNTGEIGEQDYLPAKITALIVNKSEDLILVGLQSGLLLIYEIEYGVNDIWIARVGTESFPAPIVHISEFDGFFAITFGTYCAIYKIHRSLHYLIRQPPTSQSHLHSCPTTIKFFRSFSNPLPLRYSYMMGSPLYTILLIDNANIKSYSINGQFIKSISNNAKYYSRFKDYQLHDIFYGVDQQKVVAYSVPDLRNVSIMDLPDTCDHVYENYLIGKQNIMEIGYQCG